MMDFLEIHGLTKDEQLRGWAIEQALNASFGPAPKAIELAKDIENYIRSEDYDEATLHKVRAVLERNGYTPEEAVNVISDFQNAGILFRERR